MPFKRLEKYTLKEKRSIQNELDRIASEIQAARKTAGFTQESFAEEMDLSVSTVKYIEQGRRHPSLPLLIRICKTLKIKITI